MTNLSTSSTAYKIFLEELIKHLANTKELLAHPEPLNSDQIRIVGSAFHTIKGGAGFFGLNEIADQAGVIESYFLKATSSFSESEAKELVATFEVLAEQLPGRS